MSLTALRGWLRCGSLRSPPLRLPRRERSRQEKAHLQKAIYTGGWPVLDQKPVVIPTLKEGLLFPGEFPPWKYGVMRLSELSPHWRDNEARVSAFRRFTASSEGAVTFITRSIYVPLSLRHTAQQWNWNRSSGANFSDWGYGWS